MTATQKFKIQPSPSQDDYPGLVKAAKEDNFKEFKSKLSDNKNNEEIDINCKDIFIQNIYNIPIPTFFNEIFSTFFFMEFLNR